MKEFKTIKGQIKTLSKRGLLFDNVDAAEKRLLTYGYYEIINGYKDCLLECSDSGEDRFKPHSTFEHLFSLFEMDRQIQSCVVDATLDYELQLKTAMAYHISEAYGHDEKTYLNKSNYKTGKNQKIAGHNRTELDGVLKVFDKILNDKHEPFKHYREEHGHIPAWILFKGSSLGNMKYFYKLQKKDMKNKIIRTMFGIPGEIDISADIKQLFSSLLTLSHKFRNRAAHAGRLLGYKAEYRHSKYYSNFHDQFKISKRMFDKGIGRNDLFALYIYMDLLNEKRPIRILYETVASAIEDHLKIYPQDKEFILLSYGIPEHYFLKNNQLI